jgi:hypothetical protein
MEQSYWETVGVTGYGKFAVPQSEGEINDMPDMAIPDHNFTLRELVQRYSRGLEISVRNPLPGLQDGDSEEYVPDPRHMDLAEREAYKEYAHYEIQRIRQAQSEAANKQVTEGDAAEN